MKVYVDANDIGKTVTYKEDNGKKQYLYAHDKEGFIFKDLTDYTKQVRKEVCESLDKKIGKYLSNKCRYAESLDVHSIIQQVMKEDLDQIQGETK